MEIATSPDGKWVSAGLVRDSGPLPLRAAPAAPRLLVQRQQPACLSAQGLHDRRLRQFASNPELKARSSRASRWLLSPASALSFSGLLASIALVRRRLLRSCGRLGTSSQPTRRPLHRARDRASGLLQPAASLPSRYQIDRDGPRRLSDAPRDPHPRPAARTDRRPARGGCSRSRRRHLADVPPHHLAPDLPALLSAYLVAFVLLLRRDHPRLLRQRPRDDVPALPLLPVAVPEPAAAGHRRRRGRVAVSMFVVLAAEIGRRIIERRLRSTSPAPPTRRPGTRQAAPRIGGPRPFPRRRVTSRARLESAVPPSSFIRCRRPARLVSRRGTVSACRGRRPRPDARQTGAALGRGIARAPRRSVLARAVPRPLIRASPPSTRPAVGTLTRSWSSVHDCLVADDLVHSRGRARSATR